MDIFLEDKDVDYAYGILISAPVCLALAVCTEKQEEAEEND
jgi:hypothetical protein